MKCQSHWQRLPPSIVSGQDCLDPRTHNIDDRSFTAVSQRVWNNPPPQLWQDVSCGQFKEQLRTFLFALTDHDTSWLFACLHLRNTLTYLLTFVWHHRCLTAGQKTVTWRNTHYWRNMPYVIVRWPPIKQLNCYLTDRQIDSGHWLTSAGNQHIACQLCLQCLIRTESVCHLS